jgi:tagatose 6-phosphate kinase
LADKPLETIAYTISDVTTSRQRGSFSPLIGCSAAARGQNNRMILCVTLNPCLDKTLIVPPWQPGDLVRGSAVHDVVGGKGNNVARALVKLARKPRPVTFLGGTVGRDCERLLRTEDGLDPIVVPTGSPTRVILTVRTEATSEQTAFFEPNPAITPPEAETLASCVEAQLAEERVQALCLSGSSPAAATHGLFSDLIALAQARDVPVFLDTYGPALSAIWGFWPTAIQLNRREAALHLRKTTASDSEVWGLLEEWARRGVVCGIVTDGPNPVLIRYRGRNYCVAPPTITPVNPIGSGDCLLAGLVDGWLSGLEPEPLMRHAIACAVANALVWDAGAIDPTVVARWRDQVIVLPAGP